MSHSITQYAQYLNQLNQLNMNNTYVAIMAGGIGSRFWPGSRVHRPKQFLDILGTGKSLIRLTFERFLQLCPKENIFILTNKMYREQVKEHLPELEYSQILCEPSRNNTAPCVAYTAFKLHGINPKANFVVAPSDHVILKENAFLETVRKGLDFTATHDALVTLGIRPTRPDTGYGYINFETEDADGIHEVIRFTEKPDIDHARQFVDSGEYLWNAGIFLWTAENIIRAFEQHEPEIHRMFDEIKSDLNTDKEQAIIDKTYPDTPKISIDYAIMEKAKNVYTIPSDFGWSDLGTWNSLHAEFEKDEHNNALNSDNIMTYDTSNCLIRAAKDKLVVVKDLDNYIIVDEKDVLLIYPKDKEQEIKAVTKEIGEQKGDVFL